MTELSFLGEDPIKDGGRIRRHLLSMNGEKELPTVSSNTKVACGEVWES
jgi:hypothetical protein